MYLELEQLVDTCVYRYHLYLYSSKIFLENFLWWFLTNLSSVLLTFCIRHF